MFPLFEFSYDLFFRVVEAPGQPFDPELMQIKDTITAAESGFTQDLLFNLGHVATGTVHLEAYNFNVEPVTLPVQVVIAHCMSAGVSAVNKDGSPMASPLIIKSEHNKTEWLFDYMTFQSTVPECEIRNIHLTSVDAGVPLDYRVSSHLVIDNYTDPRFELFNAPKDTPIINFDFTANVLPEGPSLSFVVQLLNCGDESIVFKPEFEMQ